MIAAQMTHHGSGSIYNAENNIIFQSVEGFVDAATPPLRDLAACADDRFVVPGGQWERARSKLTEDRFVILVGAAGTGRRTAALLLLQERCSEVHEFTPDWTRPL